MLDLETVPGDGDPGLVAGRDSEGVPGMDVTLTSSSSELSESGWFVSNLLSMESRV